MNLGVNFSDGIQIFCWKAKHFKSSHKVITQVLHLSLIQFGHRGNATLAAKKYAPTSVSQVTSRITTRPPEGSKAENLQANSKSIFRVLNPCTSSLVILVRPLQERERAKNDFPSSNWMDSDYDCCFTSKALSWESHWKRMFFLVDNWTPSV